jgi:hypothetical protein
MAFAASDAHSFARGRTDALSVEYAFFQAVRRKADQDRTKGVSLEHLSQAISIDGQPLEPAWPYIRKLSQHDYWNPPNELGNLFKRNSRRTIPDLATICAHLDAGAPVILVIYISISFFYAKPNAVILAPASEPPRNTHAIVGVGYGEGHGGRCLLIRNSWGDKWCDKGYGWIHEDYLKPRLICAGVME